MDNTKTENAKFQFEFMAMMLVSGRQEQAFDAYEKGIALLSEIIEQEKGEAI